MQPYICRDCPRGCSALRGETGAGFCKMGAESVVARMAPHFGEEPCISGERGSGAVFFSGCPLGCVFCQNEGISHGGFGKRISTADLRRGFFDLIDQGVHNVNLVNPTHFARAIDEALKDPLPVSVVWNSGGYEKVDTLKRFEGRVTVFLPDLKYVDGEIAGRYSGAPDYFEHAAPAIQEMLRQSPRVELDGDGIIQRGVVIRHLILPGHSEDSLRVLNWIAQNAKGAWVSLMAQYTPCARADQFPEINRPLTRREYERVVDHMLDLGLEDGYVQELTSSGEDAIPAFDLTGVP